MIDILSALAQETRFEIAALLARAGEDGLPAGAIADALGVPQNTLSFHLSHLERADIIRRRRAGRFIIYSAAPKIIDLLILHMAENLRPHTLKKTG